MKVIIFNREGVRQQDLVYSDLTPLIIDGPQQKFEFSYPMDGPGAEGIVIGNRLLVTDLYGEWREYDIAHIKPQVRSSKKSMKVECEASFYGMQHDALVQVSMGSVAATIALEQALGPTEWQVGTVTVSGNRDVETPTTNPLNAVHRVASAWGGELKFRVQVSGVKVINRYVDLLVRLGSYTGKRFEVGYDVQDVSLHIDKTSIRTALYGWGTANEFDANGNPIRMDFADVEWIEGEPAELYPGGPTSPAPVSKPLGQKWVGVNDAKALYGRYDPGENDYVHVFGEYDSQAESPESLIWATWRDLQNKLEPQINVKASVKALSQLQIPGVEGGLLDLTHERVRRGDTVLLIADDLLSPVEARVIEIHERRKSPGDTIIELGNFRPAGSRDLLQSMKRITDRVMNRSGIWDRATEPAEVDTVPTSALDGIIDAVNNQIIAGGGHVLMDGDGIWVLDNPDPSQALGAIRGAAMGGEAVLALGKRDLTTDPWEFRVGMTSDGFAIFGEEVVAGTIKTDVVRLEGDASFYWDASNIFILDPQDLNRQIRLGKYDGTNYGLGFTQDGGSNWQLVMDFMGLRVGASTLFEGGYDPTEKTSAYYEAHEPTLDNYPADAWDPGSYEDFLGSLFFDTTPGHVYRFAKIEDAEELGDLPSGVYVEFEGTTYQTPEPSLPQDLIVEGGAGEELDPYVLVYPFEWALALEDMVTRVNHVEFLISPEVVSSTVMSSEQFISEMDDKADASELGNLAPISQVQELEDEVDDLRETLGGIDFDEFWTRTDMDQTAYDFNFSVSRGGGVNLIRNSVGFAGFEFWDVENDDALDAIQTEELRAMGYGSGFRFLPENINPKSIRQNVNVTPGEPHVMALRVRNDITPGSSDITFRVLEDDEGTLVELESIVIPGGEQHGYDIIDLEFEPSVSQVTIEIAAGADTNATITAIQANIGSNVFQWTMHPQEIYNSNVQMDLLGIKVSRIIDGQVRGFTRITPEEFAGYYDTNDDGNFEKIFHLRDDETVSKRFVSEVEIRMGAIKVLNFESETNKGWAFVPVIEGGE